MTLTTRQLKSGRWAIYRGRVRYITTSYATRAQAVARIAVEHQWSGASFTVNHRSIAKEA